LSAEASGADPSVRPFRRINASDIQFLEETIDRYDRELPPLREFIVPAGARPAAGLHLARSVCRRAERRLVTLLRTEQPEISPSLTAYLNRLGDLLFVLARTVNHRAGCREVPWRKQS
jgi:cob(I)alamin adenosyltransferase